MITIQTKGQYAYATGPDIIAGSKGYIRAKFKFSEHWANATSRTAYFNMNGTKRAVSLDTNDECDVPDAVIANPGTLIISADGRNAQDVVLIVTNEVKIPILPSGKIDGTGITVDTDVQEILDRRRAALSYTAYSNALQSGNQLYIPASLCPLPLQDTEPEAARVKRSRVLGNTLDIT